MHSLKSPSIFFTFFGTCHIHWHTCQNCQQKIHENSSKNSKLDKSPQNNAIELFCAHYPLPIRYHRTISKKGVASHNLNAGIKQALGTYIKILFQDDVLVEDNYLEILLIVINEELKCILKVV